MPLDVVYRYNTRLGEGLLGVPAADLTQADLDALPPEALDRLKEHVATENLPASSKAYRLVTSNEQKPGGNPPPNAG